MKTIEITNANKKPLIDGYQFSVGDVIFMNNYGEECYATEAQWLDQDFRDVGFSDEFTEEEYQDCFNYDSEWYTKYEVIEDSDF